MFIRVNGLISGRFKIRFSVYIGFYIIVYLFNRVKSDSVLRSDENRIIGSVLKSSSANQRTKVNNQYQRAGANAMACGVLTEKQIEDEIEA